MFQRMNVPVLGLVENMTAFACPHCGELTEIFGRGGGERFAAQHGLEYLGGIPLDITVRQGGDVGVPAVAQREPGPAARALTTRRPDRGRPDERAHRDGRGQTRADHQLTRGRPGRALPIVRSPGSTGRALLRPVRDGVARGAPGAATGPPPADGDRRVVTALFADLVDYVRMLAEHDPEVVRARVTAALATMADSIERPGRHPREVHRRRRVRGVRLADGP